MILFFFVKFLFYVRVMDLVIKKVLVLGCGDTSVVKTYRYFRRNFCLHLQKE